jgi:hypothetical protein
MATYVSKSFGGWRISVNHHEDDRESRTYDVAVFADGKESERKMLQIHHTQAWQSLPFAEGCWVLVIRVRKPKQGSRPDGWMLVFLVCMGGQVQEMRLDGQRREFRDEGAQFKALGSNEFVQQYNAMAHMIHHLRVLVPEAE